DPPKLLALRISKGVIKIKDYNRKVKILIDRFFLKVDIPIEYSINWIILINSVNLIVISKLVIKEVI
ncbi:hypothetical protein NEUTE1DRAFT_35008, partial [Neurospora tetrasperma FGSC 2508]